MAMLCGYLCLQSAPAFVVPLFAVDGAPCFQSISGGHVLGFIEVAEEELGSMATCQQHVVCAVGDEPIYGFSTDKNNVLFGSRSKISTLVEALIPSVASNPVLILEIVNFLERPDAEITAAEENLRNYLLGRGLISN
jgi:hypothetical protein